MKFPPKRLNRHKYPIGNGIDHIRTKELLEKGFKILRLWEKDIKVMNINNFKILMEQCVYDHKAK